MNKKYREYGEYQRTRMQRDIVIRKMKEQGCRITKQRLVLLDIILEEECACCKEIYYRAVKVDKRIGSSTVYRMVNLLEEIGAISRKNMYKIACGMECEVEDACVIKMEDDTECYLNAKQWNSVVKEGLRACGFIQFQDVKSVTVKKCECDQC